MRIYIYVFLFFLSLSPAFAQTLRFSKNFSTDSLGACQGASFIDKKLYLYGDAETGVIRQYEAEGDSLVYLEKQVRLMQGGKDVINHPTGIAFHKNLPVFIGNSIRLNPEGTKWKAVIYRVNWDGMLRTGTLDGNLLQTIDDDACIQGTRPEYVRYKNKWVVATADYGDKKNEVRLYNPALLAKAKKTSEKGILIKKFTCGPWVQNLHYIAEKDILVLVQNQVQGRKWRFTFLDFSKSVDEGKEHIIKTIETDNADELEGFCLYGKSEGVAVTSSRSKNVHLAELIW